MPLLRQYIEKELAQNRLRSWTVLISGAEGMKKMSIGDARFNLVRRGWHTGAGADVEMEKERLIARNLFRIRRLVNPPDEMSGLDEVIGPALQETIKDWEIDPRGREKPTKPAGPILRKLRDPSQGLLIIYPIHADDNKSEVGDVPITAFAISFPTVDAASASKVTYTVNNVYQQNESEFN
jgi:hypothetical protein